MLARAVVASAALALTAAVPAAAAPVLQPLKPCYVSVDPATRENVLVRASGFTPFSLVDPLIDGSDQVPDGVRADAAGRVRGVVQAPYVASGERPFTLQLVERDRPQDEVSASALVTALFVDISPARARPSRRVRFTGSGFTARRAIFAHYVFGGRLRRTVRLAPSDGVCGDFSVRARQIPIDNPQTGRWTLQVDQQRRYSAQPASVAVRITIVVKRRPAAAQAG
jgi:hypothetical protein